MNPALMSSGFFIQTMKTTNQIINQSARWGWAAHRSPWQEVFEQLGLTQSRVPLDLSEAETGYLVRLEAVGRTKENFDISMDDGVLVVNSTATEGTNKRPPFSRRVLLPGEVDVHHVTASYENGVLEIRLPKAAATQPHKINID